MSDVSPVRRVFPPPGQPGLLEVLVRWRVEILLVCGVVALWHYAGGEVAAVLAMVGTALTMVLKPARRFLVAMIQSVVVPHRLRSALVQGGVTDRDGRLPWIMWARPKGDAVVASVWLRSGTTPADLRSAIPVVSAACGAQATEVVRRFVRQDWAAVVVHRPRWGLPG